MWRLRINRLLLTRGLLDELVDDSLEDRPVPDTNDPETPSPVQRLLYDHEWGKSRGRLHCDDTSAKFSQRVQNIAQLNMKTKPPRHLGIWLSCGNKSPAKHERLSDVGCDCAE